MDLHEKISSVGGLAKMQSLDLYLFIFVSFLASKIRNRGSGLSYILGFTFLCFFLLLLLILIYVWLLRKC